MVDSAPLAATPDMLACADQQAVLVPDTGDYSRPINAALPEAQAYFDQGCGLPTAIISLRRWRRSMRPYVLMGITQ